MPPLELHAFLQSREQITEMGYKLVPRLREYLLHLAEGREFTQPRANLIAPLCTAGMADSNGVSCAAFMFMLVLKCDLLVSTF